MKTYPVIVKRIKQNPLAQIGQGKPCTVCGIPTTGKIEIEVSYMRGDDELVACCGLCQKATDKELITAIFNKNKEL